MPEKVKKTVKLKNKLTNKYEVQNYYLKCTSITELQSIIDNPNTKLKVKAKCIKELIKRKKI